MRVKLIDMDSHNGMPNLALMKLKAWHVKQGDECGFDVAIPDKVYISCIFSWNAPIALGVAKMFDCEVEIGGYGVNGAKLPYEVEHCMPDYDLYEVDFSMGFTSRGCIRRCPFCSVWQKEGRIKQHADLEEFLHPKHKKVIIMDNNLLASPKVEETLRKIINLKLKVCFTQGLDLRLMTKEYARMLKRIRYTPRTFHDRMLYAAWDRMEDEEQIMRGLKMLIDAGCSPYHIMVYMLTGFDTTFKEDMYRFEKLRELKVNPFVMLYKKSDSIHPLILSRERREFARWVNKRFYKWVPFHRFENFLRGEGKEKENKLHI